MPDTPVDEWLVHALGEQEWRIIQLEEENERLRQQVRVLSGEPMATTDSERVRRQTDRARVPHGA